jgi:hypothetical protein
MAQSAQSKNQPQLCRLQCRLGPLANALAESQRDRLAKIHSTNPAPLRMIKVNQHIYKMIEVSPARYPEEPVAVIPHAGICEGDVGQPTFLP